jgi:hypothetical protein
MFPCWRAMAGVWSDKDGGRAALVKLVATGAACVCMGTAQLLVGVCSRLSGTASARPCGCEARLPKDLHTAVHCKGRHGVSSHSLQDAVPKAATILQPQISRALGPGITLTCNA